MGNRRSRLRGLPRDVRHQQRMVAKSLREARRAAEAFDIGFATALLMNGIDDALLQV